MDKLAQNLIDIGIDKNQANLYLAALKLGKATVSDIARIADIKRTTVYQHIDQLLKNDLIFKTIKGKRIYYLAQKPEKILKKIENKKRRFAKVLPELNSIYSQSSHKPNIRYYEGIEGIREIYNEMTKTSKILYSIFSADKYYANFSEEDGNKFFENIRKNGGILKDMVEKTDEGRQYAKEGYHKELGKVKILPKEFELAVDVLVTGNQVAMISQVNLVGVIVENPEIADFQKNIFKFIWKYAK